MNVLYALVFAVLLNSACPYRIVCYYESWAVYRPGNGKFDVENIDPFLCTHLVYSFVTLNAEGNITFFDPWNDINRGGIKSFNELRKQNPNLVTMVAIGGGTANTETFSKVINDCELRSKFAENVITFMKEYDFNGFDLDWEYPTNKSAFTELLKLLRPKFIENGYQLSAAVAAGFWNIWFSYDVPALGRYLDFINVMSYDLHGSWEHMTGENAPLYAGYADRTGYQRRLNVDSVLRRWIQKGAPRKKLNLGMASFGRTFTLKNTKKFGVGAPTIGPGYPGPYTQGPGSLGYNEICEQHKAGIWTTYWNKKQQVIYAVNDTQWVGYDDKQSINLKAKYVKNNGLGGAMVWSIDTDDFRNICGDGKYPLITSIKSVLG